MSTMALPTNISKSKPTLTTQPCSILRTSSEPWSSEQALRIPPKAKLSSFTPDRCIQTSTCTATSGHPMRTYADSSRFHDASSRSSARSNTSLTSSINPYLEYMSMMELVRKTSCASPLTTASP
uniref:Uncharacterized protein n=1 Tax=Triticum urartu TaxID=4572 RepID=A0A8R7Q6Y6_TRIUA